MKQFTVLLAVLGVLAALGIYHAKAASKSTSVAENESALPIVYDSTGAMQEAINAEGAQQSIPVTGADAGIPPVYDSTGAMLEAITAKEVKVNADLPIVYDATGAMLDAITP